MKVESMSEKGEFDKYNLRGCVMQANSREAELVDVTHDILSLVDGGCEGQQALHELPEDRALR